jgi:hypothetical protein
MGSYVLDHEPDVNSDDARRWDCPDDFLPSRNRMSAGYRLHRRLNSRADERSPI